MRRNKNTIKTEHKTISVSANTRSRMKSKIETSANKMSASKPKAKNNQQIAAMDLTNSDEQVILSKRLIKTPLRLRQSAQAKLLSMIYTKNKPKELDVKQTTNQGKNEKVATDAKANTNVKETKKVSAQMKISSVKEKPSEKQSVHVTEMVPTIAARQNIGKKNTKHAQSKEKPVDEKTADKEVEVVAKITTRRNVIAMSQNPECQAENRSVEEQNRSQSKGRTTRAKSQKSKETPVEETVQIDKVSKITTRRRINEKETKNVERNSVNYENVPQDKVVPMTTRRKATAKPQKSEGKSLKEQTVPEVKVPLITTKQKATAKSSKTQINDKPVKRQNTPQAEVVTKRRNTRANPQMSKKNSLKVQEIVEQESDSMTRQRARDKETYAKSNENTEVEKPAEIEQSVQQEEVNPKITTRRNGRVIALKTVNNKKPEGQSIPQTDTVPASRNRKQKTLVEDMAGEQPPVEQRVEGIKKAPIRQNSKQQKKDAKIYQPAVRLMRNAVSQQESPKSSVTPSTNELTKRNAKITAGNNKENEKVAESNCTANNRSSPKKVTRPLQQNSNGADRNEMNKQKAPDNVSAKANDATCLEQIELLSSHHSIIQTTKKPVKNMKGDQLKRRIATSTPFLSPQRPQKPLKRLQLRKRQLDTDVNKTPDRLPIYKTFCQNVNENETNKSKQQSIYDYPSLSQESIDAEAPSMDNIIKKLQNENKITLKRKPIKRKLVNHEQRSKPVWAERRKNMKIKRGLREIKKTIKTNHINLVSGKEIQLLSSVQLNAKDNPHKSVARKSMAESNNNVPVILLSSSEQSSKTSDVSATSSKNIGQNDENQDQHHEHIDADDQDDHHFDNNEMFENSNLAELSAINDDDDGGEDTLHVDLSKISHKNYSRSSAIAKQARMSHQQTKQGPTFQSTPVRPPIVNVTKSPWRVDIAPLSKAFQIRSISSVNHSKGYPVATVIRPSASNTNSSTVPNLSNIENVEPENHNEILKDAEMPVPVEKRFGIRSPLKALKITDARSQPTVLAQAKAAQENLKSPSKRNKNTISNSVQDYFGFLSDDDDDDDDLENATPINISVQSKIPALSKTPVQSQANSNLQYIDKHPRINELRNPLRNKPIASVASSSSKGSVSKLKLGKPLAFTTGRHLEKSSTTNQRVNKPSSTTSIDLTRSSSSKQVDQVPSTQEISYEIPTTSKDAYAIPSTSKDAYNVPSTLKDAYAIASTSKDTHDNPSTITKNIFDIPSSSQYTIEDMFNKTRTTAQQQQKEVEEIPAIIEEPCEYRTSPVLFTTLWGDENETLHRTYSRKRKRERNISISYSDSENEEILKSPRKKRGHKANTKKVKELNAFAEKFNSMCEEVDKYELIVEKSS